MGVAVFQKLWDTSDNLKHTDTSKSSQNGLTLHFQNNSPFARRLSLSLLTLQLCSYASWFPSKEITEKFEVEKKKVSSEECLVYQATF